MSSGTQGNETLVHVDHSNGLDFPTILQNIALILTPALSETIQVLTPERHWDPLAFDRV